MAIWSKIGRVATAIAVCATLISPGTTTPARATPPGVTQMAQHAGVTFAPRVVDWSVAPKLVGPVGEEPDRYLHNNISWANHLAAKKRAAAQLRAAKDKINAGFKPSLINDGINHAGITEPQGGAIPPDGDIAASRSYVLHIVNFDVSVYNKTASLLKRSNFATFFQNTTDFIFDPRVYWDPYWDRFVVLCDGTVGSGATQQSYIELAISTTNDPRGSYYIYRFSVTPQGDFLDYPQLGMDQDAIIATGNDFTASGGFDAYVFSLPKARMYSGMGAGFTYFNGIGCTVAPPYVLDSNSASYILSACPNDNRVYLGAYTNTSRSSPSLNLWQAVISVPAYSVPPDVPQPGTNYTLETLDNEFEQRSVQLGTRIWNVHTIADGTATPRWYEFDTGANSLVADGLWYATTTSSDWRPSIVMNGAGQTFGTWMSVDVPNKTNIAIHYIGGSGDSAGFGGGSVLYTSSQPLTGQTANGRDRDGDYSYITLDPSSYGSCGAYERAWLEGEDTSSANEWGTRLGLVGNC